MARTRRGVGAPAAPPALRPVTAPVLDKVRALAAQVGGLKTLAHEAQVREAVTRTELTLALHESLATRAGLLATLRDQALAAYRTRRPATLRLSGRRAQMLDRLLIRLGSLGQACVIARSGVWRGTGRPLHDFRHMAAYARRGANPAVAPLAQLDQAWYLAANPDVAARGIAPLVHYLVSGGREGRAPSGLFEPTWYAGEHAAELAATSVTPLEHFVRTGAGGQGGPHPLFDVGHYLAQSGPLAAEDDALSHYLREGWTRGFTPHPLFDPAWYRRQVETTEPALSHYLTTGWREGLSPHPLFDGRWYLEQNPEVAAAGVEPLTHFMVEGGPRGLSPGPWFDAAHYIATRGDALAPGVNPLVDYLLGGAWAIAEARPGFPTAAYLAKQPGLARDGVTPLEHWARQGAP